MLPAPPVPGTDEPAAVCWSCEAWGAVVELRWHRRSIRMIKGLAESRLGQSSPVPAAQQWIWLVRSSAWCVGSALSLEGNEKAAECECAQSTRTRAACALSWLWWTAELAASRWFQSRCLLGTELGPVRGLSISQLTVQLQNLYLFYKHTCTLKEGAENPELYHDKKPRRVSQGINLAFINLSSCFPYVEIVLVKVVLR